MSARTFIEACADADALLAVDGATALAWRVTPDLNETIRPVFDALSDDERKDAHDLISQHLDRTGLSTVHAAELLAW